jgi:phosphoglycerate dehydrogenase-like enzyme
MDNVDEDYAKSKGIKCINAPEGNRDAVAEHVIGMLLSLSNNLNIADEQVRQGIWDREGNRGWELKGKTLAIIGYGNNGMIVQETTKEERDAGNKGAILGNCKVVVQAQSAAPVNVPKEDDFGF